MVYARHLSLLGRTLDDRYRIDERLGNFAGRGYLTDYMTVPLDEKGVAAVKPGKNVLAVHCKQTGGGQYIDAGLVKVEETSK